MEGGFNSSRFFGGRSGAKGGEPEAGGWSAVGFGVGGRRKERNDIAQAFGLDGAGGSQEKLESSGDFESAGWLAARFLGKRAANQWVELGAGAKAQTQFGAAVTGTGCPMSSAKAAS